MSTSPGSFSTALVGLPRVSLVIPSRTGQVEALRAQLARQTLQGWELVVIAGIAPPARARNLGAAKATGDLLIFLDDDIELPDAHLLEDLARAAQASGSEAVVGVLWCPPPDASAFQRRQQDESFAPPVEPVDVMRGRVAWDVLGTACCAVWRAAFQDVGGFDDALTSAEDAELWYRLHRRGGEVFVLRGRWIQHEPPRTVGAMVRKAIWHEWGNAQMTRKHPESGYRMVLRGPAHAAAYLLARTVMLVPLMFLKVSYRYRRPALAFRPIAACLSYIGAWAYCLSWFTPSKPRAEASMPAREHEAGVVMPARS